jgi:hypothetical protein
VVGGPAHGPRVDVVQLAACARARALVTLAILKEILLAMSHHRRDGALVPHRDEGQPPPNGGDGDNVDDRPRLGLIQLLRSALARLPPPGGGGSCGRPKLEVYTQFGFCFFWISIFMCGLHIDYTKLPGGTCYAFSPAARRIVEEGIDHGTVTVHQNRPTDSILLVRLHQDTEQQQHAPVPAAFQGSVEFGAGPLKERGRGDEQDKIRPHLLVVAPERSAVDKLLAKEVLVPDIKAAGDFGPFTTTPASFGGKSLLHAPHQP